MSVAEKVDDLNSIKESFARAEKLAEEVISLRNEVIGLSKKKELSREGWRAIQKMESGKSVWLSLGFVISSFPKMFISTIQIHLLNSISKKLKTFFVKI